MGKEITKDTNLILIRDWKTPYESFSKGEYSTAEYWALKLGRRIDIFFTDFKYGFLDDWFKIHTNEEQESELNDLLKKCWIASRMFFTNNTDKNFNDFLSVHNSEISSYFKKIKS